jgi:16S rRNA (adenine1518-N6/adenine1519-N6)-dimethyltransferase
MCLNDRRTLTLSPRRIGELLESHGIDPRRGLGQNFVADPNTVRRIARLAGVGAGDRVVEIGPGLGSLTLALVETGAEIVAVEADDRLLPVLADVLAGTGVRVVHGDALTIDWEAVFGPDGGEPWSLVANLPYNVAATLVLDLLDHVPRIARMLVMVQKEVGDRLAAPAGSPAYGIPSVKLAYRATARVVAQVPATVFVPQPRVASVLVAIERRADPPTTADPDELFALVRRAFNQRRKMLRRSLADIVDADAFAAAGIDATRRPEELDVVDWGRLAHAVAGRADR